VAADAGPTFADLQELSYTRAVVTEAPELAPLWDALVDATRTLAKQSK